ncbi:MAG: hypothetical protein WA837_02965 [Xanthobacteraceae bacterium]
MSDVKKPKTKPPRVQPKRQSSRRRKDVNIPAMIDDFFTTRISVKEGETPRYATCFEAIIHHLWTKETAGSRKAGKLLVRYLNFAASQGSPGGFDIRVIPDPPEDEQAE